MCIHHVCVYPFAYERSKPSSDFRVCKYNIMSLFFNNFKYDEIG